jgi:hypothetical protein
MGMILLYYDNFNDFFLKGIAGAPGTHWDGYGAL